MATRSRPPVDASSSGDQASRAVAVHIEPLPGVPANELQRALKAAGATSITRLTKTLLSAEMSLAKIKDLESVANVEVMTQKFMRRRPLKRPRGER